MDADKERSDDEGKSLEQRKKIGKKPAKKGVYNKEKKKVYNKTQRDKEKRARLLQLETSVATVANSAAGHSSSLLQLETFVATGANLAAGHSSSLGLLETSVATGANSAAGHSSSLRLLETSVATGTNSAAGHLSSLITYVDETSLHGMIVRTKAELEWYKQQLNAQKAVSAANLAFAEEAHRKLAEASLLSAAKDEKLARFEESNFSFSLNDMDGWLLDDDTGLGIQSTCATSGEGLYSHNIANKEAFENLGVPAIKANSRDVDCGKYLESFRAFGDFVKGIEPLNAYPIPLDEDIFGANVEVPLQRVDMEHISQMQQLSVSCIMLYMSHLYRVMKSGNFGRKFFFVNPSAISGATEELVGGSKSALLANLLEGVQNGQLAFVPYNLGLHWILLVIDLSSATVYYLDSLYLDIIDVDMKFIVNSAIEIYDSTKGNKRSPTWKQVKCPQQSTKVECGFYVMRFMKELIADQSILSKGDFNGKVAYTKDEIDEVRFDWMKLIVGLICGKVGHREEDAVNIGDEVVQHATMGSFIEPTDGTS